MDLNALNLNVNRLLSNIWAVITFLKEFTIDEAKDVSITHINNDGTESVKTFSNISKQYQNFENWKSDFTSSQSQSLENWKSGFYGTQSLAMPLNYNAFMHNLGNGHLENWGTTGNVSIEAMSPLTKGFEGSYSPNKTESMVDTEESATGSNPMWFGVYNKGPRVNRGGLDNGWGATTGGKILKITKPEGPDHSYNNSAVFSLIETFKRNKFRFRGYIWIEKGSLTVNLRHIDDGGSFNVPSHKQWHFIDTIVSQSEICSNSMRFSIKGSEECEMYVAMMNILPVVDGGNDSTIINRRTK